MFERATPFPVACNASRDILIPNPPRGISMCLRPTQNYRKKGDSPTTRATKRARKSRHCVYKYCSQVSQVPTWSSVKTRAIGQVVRDIIHVTRREERNLKVRDRLSLLSSEKTLLAFFSLSCGAPNSQVQVRRGKKSPINSLSCTKRRMKVKNKCHRRWRKELAF